MSFLGKLEGNASRSLYSISEIGSEKWNQKTSLSLNNRKARGSTLVRESISGQKL